MERDTTHRDTVTCPSCLAENHVFQSFCRMCGTPIGATTNLDPFHIIRSEGNMLLKALEGRPKFIVLLGIWILHLPALVVGTGMVIHIMRDVKDGSDLVFMAIFTAISYFAFIVLYRITRNYLAGPESGSSAGKRRLVMSGS